MLLTGGISSNFPRQRKKPKTSRRTQLHLRGTQTSMQHYRQTITVFSSQGLSNRSHLP